MNILGNAKKHFKDQLDDELLCIEVPEWGDADGEGEVQPAKIYYRKLMSLKTQNKINFYAKDGDLDSLVETLILRSLDADGKRMWKPRNKTELQQLVDPEVIGRICEEMGADDLTIEDAGKNSAATES
jgi:hypothetical protein